MSTSNESDYLWDGTGAADAEVDRLQSLLAPMAPRPPVLPRRRRGLRTSLLLSVLTFLFVFAALPPRLVPSRIAGLFHDNFPGEIGVQGGTRVEYSVVGDDLSLDMTKRVAKDLKARGANVVFVRAGSVIIDLVGVGPDSVPAWSRGFGAYGKLGLTQVHNDTPFMRGLRNYHRQLSPTSDLQVGVQEDFWRAESGPQQMDYYLRGPSPEALRTFVADMRARQVGLMLPAGTELAFEKVKPPRPDEPAYYRSYVVSSEAAVTHEHIAAARVVFNQFSNRPEVLVTLTGTGRTVFANLTRDNVGKKLAIMLDGNIMSAPVIQSAITGGRVSITLGADSADPLAEAQGLAATLQNGVLSAPVQLASVTPVAPSLSDGALLAARALFALPFALLVLGLGMAIARFTPRIDPEVFPLRNAESDKRRLWRRMLVTIAGMVAAIHAVRIPLPAINREQLANLGASPDMFSVFSFGLVPVLSAFLLVELGALLHPRWRRLRVSGYAGRARMGQVTVVTTLVLAFAQAYFFTKWLGSFGQMWPGTSLIAETAIWPTGTIMLSLVGGVMLLVVLASLITRYGLGNGYVIVVLAGMVKEGWHLGKHAVNANFTASTLGWLVVFVTVVVALVTATLRLTVRSSQSSASYRLPTCGVVPLVWTAVLLILVSLVTMSGFQVPFIWHLLQPNGQIDPTVFVAVAAVLAVALSIAFSFPARWRSSVRLVNPKPASPLADMGFWRACAISAAVLSAMAALYLWGGGTTMGAPSILWLAVVTAAVMDIIADVRARYRNPTLVAVWPLHRVQMSSVAADALTARGIDVHLQGLYFRSLFFFFAPFAPIRVMVPADRAEEAADSLRALLAEERPAQAA